MTLEQLTELTESKMKKNSRIPRSVILLVAELLHTAYLIGRDGEDEVSTPDALHDEAMIAKFLETNEVTVVTKTWEEDPTQTPCIRLEH